MRTRATMGGNTRIGLARASRAIAALVALASATCATVDDQDGDQEPAFGRSQQALTSEQTRVLGFETPTADWSSNAGTLGTSSNANNGTAALTVVPAGWTEINSISLSTLANVRDTLSYDIYLPQVPGWGETRAILTSPSLGQWWTELGRQELNQLPAGQYSTVSFPLSSSLVTLLSGSYSDLKIKLVINAPALSQPYRLDHLVMTNEGAPPPSGSAEPETFTVLLPSGVGVQDTFMSATDHLSLFSQARAGVTGSVPAIANFGPFTTYLQAEARAYANIFSAGPVQLDVKTRVEGAVTTEGTIGKQGVGTNDAPVVVGGEFPQTNVDSELVSWSVEWPSPVGPDIQLNAAPTQTPVNTTLAPGAYGDFNVHSRNHVFLSSGTYFFDTFNTEPEAQLHLDTSSGAIVIYVKQNLPWGGGIGSKAPVFTDDGDEAQLLLAFLGTGDVFVQGSWQGTIVAPDALIKLERPSNPGISGAAPGHEGAFFGKSVEVAAGQHTVLHTSFVGGFDIFADDDNSCTADTLSPAGVINEPLPVGAACELLGSDGGVGHCDGAGQCRSSEDLTEALSPPNSGDGPRGFSSKARPLQPYNVEAPHAFYSRNFDDPAGQVPPLGGPLVLALQLPEPPTLVRISAVSRLTGEILQLDPPSLGGCVYQAISGYWGSPSSVIALETIDLPVCSITPPPAQVVSGCGLPNPSLVDEIEVPANVAMIDITANLHQLFVPSLFGSCGIPPGDLDTLPDVGDDTATIDLTEDGTGFLSFGGSSPVDGVSEIILQVDVDRQSAPLAVHDSRICVEWNADYIDEGYGETVAGPYRASYANYFLQLKSPRVPTTLTIGVNVDPITGAVLAGSGAAKFLDADGCVPTTELDPDLLVHKPGDPVDGLEFEMRVRTLMYPTGSKGFTVRRATNAIPALDLTDADIDLMNSLVLRVRNDPGGGLSTADWDTQDGWALPPETILLSNPTLDPLINASATISQILITPDIDIDNALYDVIVGAGCVPPFGPHIPDGLGAPCMIATDCVGIETACLIPTGSAAGTCGCNADADCSSEGTCIGGRCAIPSRDSCAGDNELFIGPATLPLDTHSCTVSADCEPTGQDCITEKGLPCVSGQCWCRWVDQSRWKFVNAHEAGHMIQSRLVGERLSAEYLWDCDTPGGICPGPKDVGGLLFDPPGADPMCGCSHVSAANKLHCIQSLERMGSAEGEGFAQFFASRVWNAPGNPDACVFNYYKEMLLNDCPDPDLDCQPEGSRVKVIPPMPIPCSEQDRWRNDICRSQPATNGRTLAALGTERDWMQFLWNWNVRGPNNTDMKTVFEAYKQICHPAECIGPGGARFPGCNTEKCENVDVGGGVKELPRFEWLLPAMPVRPSPPAGFPPTPTPAVYATQIAAYNRALADFARTTSYRDGVVAYYDGLIAAANQAGDVALRDLLQNKRAHFTAMALAHGVDENTTP